MTSSLEVWSHVTLPGENASALENWTAPPPPLLTLSPPGGVPDPREPAHRIVLYVLIGVVGVVGETRQGAT